MKIGVFDSGVGGQSVAKAIELAFPDAEILLRQDRANVPYGNKHPDELVILTMPIFSEMVKAGCDIIVIACNTVSTSIIAPLREAFEIPLIVMEPMIEQAAAQTKSGIITVCATPATLRSKRYQMLKETYATELTVLEPDCSDWAFMIEHGQIEGAKIANRINAALKAGTDVIVLGCTHYHWIEHQIRVLCDGRAKVLQPEKLVIAQLEQELARLA